MNIQPTISRQLLSPEAILVRRPWEDDAVAVWELVEATPELAHNSHFCYLLQFRHFAGTCSVAELMSHIVGFVTAHRPPAFPDVLFIWQIAVTADFRRRGLACSLINDLLQRPEACGVRFIETTIAPANHASKGLFQAIARQLNASYTETPFLMRHPVSAASLPKTEDLIRIGPLLP